jgi:Tfp pilus assembly protein PilF
MNAYVELGNAMNTYAKRMSSLRFAILFFLVASSGCASLSRSGDSKAIAATSSLDAKSLAMSQAALALDRAEVAEQQGKKDEAIRYYEQARVLDPKLAHLSRRLAVLYDQRGDDTRARAAYAHALQLQPRDADLLNDFGVYHLHREDWAAAETWFSRSLAVDPTHQRATNNLAMSLAMQNRLNESYEAFSRVVGPAAAYSNIGVLLTREGRIDEAREHFQRALALDRTIHPAGEFLSRLDRRSEATISSTSNPPVQPVSYQPESHR